MKTREQHDAGMPPGSTSAAAREHFDMPSVDKYKRHKACAACKRMIHPARNCKCSRCKELT